MKHHEAGKGSKQRPGNGYASGWDRIWGSKAFTHCPECNEPLNDGACVNQDCDAPWSQPKENAL